MGHFMPCVSVILIYLKLNFWRSDIFFLLITLLRGTPKRSSSRTCACARLPNSLFCTKPPARSILHTLDTPSRIDVIMLSARVCTAQIYMRALCDGGMIIFFCFLHHTIVLPLYSIYIQTKKNVYT